LNLEAGSLLGRKFSQVIPGNAKRGKSATSHDFRERNAAGALLGGRGERLRTGETEKEKKLDEG